MASRGSVCAPGQWVHQQKADRLIDGDPHHDGSVLLRSRTEGPFDRRQGELAGCPMKQRPYRLFGALRTSLVNPGRASTSGGRIPPIPRPLAVLNIRNEMKGMPTMTKRTA